MRTFNTQQTTPASGKYSHSLYLILIISILLATTLLRTIHLNADPVPWFTNEFGYQIDEGYKTLSARNLYLYGDTHWNPEDQYTGWMKRSPITQWPYYWAFKSLGLELSSARTVSIIYSVMFLALAAALLLKRASPGIAVIGVLLLASDPALFLFSRSALFETCLILFIYAGLFLAVMLPPRYQNFSIVPVICMAIPAMFFVKLTAIVYIAPVVLCLALVTIQDRMGMSKNIRKYMIALSVILVLISAILYTNQSAWIHKVNLSGILTKPQKLFSNPMHTLSPLALILAHIVLLELLIRQPEVVLKDGYRLSLASLVVLVPIIFSLFFYHPSRYYVPLVPAALLLVIERLSLTLPEKSKGKFQWFSIPSLLAAIVFLALAMSILIALNYYIVSNLPIAIGDDPGISLPTLLKLYPLFVAVFAVFIYFVARRYWSRASSALYTSLAGLHILIGLGISFAAVVYPDYQAHEIRSRIMQHVKPDESIGGDWAPYFAANTEMYALYMRPDMNRPTRIMKLRPDYFLDSDTTYDRETFAGLLNVNTISIGEAVPLGTFRGNEISLHPIHYHDKDGNPARKPDRIRPVQ